GQIPEFVIQYLLIVMKNHPLIISLLLCMLCNMPGLQSQNLLDVQGTIAKLLNSPNGTKPTFDKFLASPVTIGGNFGFEEQYSDNHAAIGNNIIADNQTICYNTAPAALTGSAPTGGNGSFSYQWQSSTSSAITGFADIDQATSQGYAPGILTTTTWYRRIVSSGAEHDTSTTIQISADPLPVTTIAYSGTPYCATGTATVTQTGQGGGTYSSAAGLSLNASTGEINLAASASGNYTVNYTFSNGACTSTATTNVEVGNPTLTITNPLPVCGSPTADITHASITAGSSSGLTYYYFTDAAGTVPLNNPSAITTNDTYYIQGKSASGCSTAVKPVVVVINDQPVITAVEEAYVCKGSSVTLTANSPGNEIIWQNAGTGNSIVVQPSISTTYKAIAINGSGCTDTVAVKVYVRDFKVSLIANPSPMLVGTLATLTTTANINYEVIAWKPEIYFSNQTANTQSLIVNDTTNTFYVIAKSEDGCLDTANVKTAVDNTDFFIPNAFTPNNDGKNDAFKIYGSSVIGAEIKIYNQWGVMLYETKDNDQGWNGTYKNNPQPVGMYLYVVKVRLSNEDTFIKKGTIRLIR
ncbi:MAG TPA: gliding motility-associated C-terminal domain-containing protein, partial [Agriterribacter sp.]|nr:gliding motility-associated C-terminal domain-containing protein [Agriterribacter sp.]